MTQEVEVPQIRIYSSNGEELIPEQMTDGSVGIDVKAPQDIVLPPGATTKINSGLVVDVSEFSQVGKPIFTLACPRSSAGIKKGVYLLNTVGVIDPDYCGQEDEMYFFMGRRHADKEVVEHFTTTVPLGNIKSYEDIEYYLRSFMYDEYGRAGVNTFFEWEIIESDKHHHKVRVVMMKCVGDRDFVVYEKGERFAQLLFLPYHPSSLKTIEKEQLKEDARGGFGSTGDE